MAENSPSKTTRSAVMYHPYGRNKSSPSKLASNSRPLTLTNMNEGNYFSFSGGSSSLFPASNTSRPAMREVSNLLEKNLIIKNPVPSSVTKQEQEEVKTKNVTEVGVIGGHRQNLIIKNPVPSSVAKQEQEEVKTKNVTEVGVIGGHRQSKKPPSLGFIPIEDSFKIVGMKEEGRDHMTKKTSFTLTSNVHGEDENRKPSQPPHSHWPIFEHKGIPVTGKSFFPPRSSSFSIYEDGNSRDSSVTSTSRGILCERKNPLYDFPEYSLDILNYWLAYEKRSRPKRMYMSKQPEISHRMRTILVDWIVEVGMEYDMHGETIFLAVSCVDRFLSKMSVARNKLQLIGTAALFISSKYEEIQPPEIGDFVYITDETYTKEQVLQMELIMLNILSYDLMAPTAYDFVRTFSSILRLDSQTTCLAMYLTELAMMDGERYLLYLPSIIATAAISLSRYTFQGMFWDEKITILTPHGLRDVQRCAQHLFNSFYDAPTLDQTAIYDKYKAVRYCSISQTTLPVRLPWV